MARHLDADVTDEPFCAYLRVSGIVPISHGYSHIDILYCLNSKNRSVRVRRVYSYAEMTVISDPVEFVHRFFCKDVSIEY